MYDGMSTEDLEARAIALKGEINERNAERDRIGAELRSRRAAEVLAAAGFVVAPAAAQLGVVPGEVG